MKKNKTLSSLIAFLIVLVSANAQEQKPIPEVEKLLDKMTLE